MTRPSRSLADRSAEYIRKHRLTGRGDHVLAAVSGGPDSIALADILTRLQDQLELRPITIAHFDHRLRGSESDADREFVEEFARSRGLPFTCGTADVRSFGQERGMSMEMAARECRHSFLKDAARKSGANRIALGHNLDDRAEEVLMRLLRGSGPAGLTGMLPAGGEGIIRPLLFASRAEIAEYLAERGLAYRVDSSNLEPVCQRNALRLRVFPILEEVFHPEVSRTIARYAELAADEEDWWDDQVRAALDRCLRAAESGAALDLAGLRELHPALVRRVLRRVVEKVRGGAGGIHLVHIEPLFAMALRDMPGKRVHLPGEIEALQRGAPDPRRALMDADKVRWPLCVRFWKPGDRFRPLGMRGSKKLQDFFTDSGVPREQRGKIPILCDRDKICWVAGLRLDDRVKTGPRTLRVVSVRLSEEK